MASDSLRLQFCVSMVDPVLVNHFSVASIVQQRIQFDGVFREEFFGLKESLKQGKIDEKECEARMQHALITSIKRSHLLSAKLKNEKEFDEFFEENGKEKN